MRALSDKAMQYYHIRGMEMRNQGVVSVPNGFDEYAFWDDIEVRTSCDGWSKIETMLKPLASGSTAILRDWPPSDLIMRLCSEKLMQIISPFSDSLVWLPVVVDDDGSIHYYYIMHFSSFPDVLDSKKSTYVNGRLLRPHLAKNKTTGRHVFALAPLDVSPIVSAEVRSAIEQSGCSGLQFERVPCS